MNPAGRARNKKARGSQRAGSQENRRTIFRWKLSEEDYKSMLRQGAEVIRAVYCMEPAVAELRSRPRAGNWAGTAICSNCIRSLALLGTTPIPHPRLGSTWMSLLAEELFQRSRFSGKHTRTILYGMGPEIILQRDLSAPFHLICVH